MGKLVKLPPVELAWKVPKFTPSGLEKIRVGTNCAVGRRIEVGPALSVPS